MANDIRLKLRTQQSKNTFGPNEDIWVAGNKMSNNVKHNVKELDTKESEWLPVQISN